jgi:hypothetical protein
VDPSRWLLRAAGVLSLLLIAVVVNAVLHGDETGSNPLNPVAQAAERTAAVPGGRFALRATYSSAALPAPVTATGSGAYNSQTGRSSGTLVVPNAQVGPVKIEAVADGTTCYVRSPLFAGKLPEGKTWMEIDPFLGEGEPGFDAAGGTSTKSSLEMLAGSGEVHRLGGEKVRGVPTTRYRATIDYKTVAGLVAGEGKDAVTAEYEKLAEAMPQGSPVEVWIGADGVVRRIRQTMTLPAETGAPVTMELREDLFAFGAEPDIAIPDSSEVFDTTPLVREELQPGESS